MSSPTGVLDQVTIHLLDLTQIIARVQQAIETQSRLSIGYVNAHVLNLASQHPRLHTLLNHLDICYCDGIGPVWALRSQGHVVPGRIPGRTAIPALMAEAAKHQWRVGWAGGEPGVVKLASEKLQVAFPDLHIAWTSHGFHDESTQGDEIRRLQDSQVDLLLVGMGTPIQEEWIQRHIEKLDIPVVWCVGATADYLSGTRKTGPRILLTHQEWMARLVAEPQRMWRRYMIGNPRFIYRTVKGHLWKPKLNKP